MRPDRAIEVTETHPPPEGAPWDDFGEPLAPDDGAEPPFEAEAQGGPATPQPRRWRLLPRSLSSRLVVFVVALVVAVVSVAGCATYISLKSFLYERLDQQVAASPVRTRAASRAACFVSARSRGARSAAGRVRTSTPRRRSG